METFALKAFGKHSLLLAALSLFFNFVHADVSQNIPKKTLDDWQNEAVFRINKEAPAVPLHFYNSRKAALDSHKTLPYQKSLVGEWHFKYFPNFQKASDEFLVEDLDVSSWKKIPVPSTWQLQEYGTPLYTNITYPFKVNPPNVTDEPNREFTNHIDRNPVGIYRRTFTVPEDWRGGSVFVNFEGVSSAFYLWINGRKVGYSQDSRTSAVFDISKYLRHGENVIAAKVFQYSDGSYFEDQDFWRLSGIFRDVSLFWRPELRLSDVFVRAGLDKSYKNGTLSVELLLKNSSKNSNGCRIFGELISPQGKPIARASTKDEIVAAGKSILCKWDFPILSNVKTWTAEEPNLYKLLITFEDSAGRKFYAVENVGFRSVERKDGQILLNGKAILFKGVNRHEFTSHGGYICDEKTMRADIMQMKKYNINAIRTSHYPNDVRFYKLCDELGMYVIDEANIEMHGLDKLCDKFPVNSADSWGRAILDRIKNMVERDKNRPCVVIWSLGNETNDGINFKRASEWISLRDASRPVHWDRCQSMEYVDMMSRMYYTTEQLKNFLKEQQAKLPIEKRLPVIICEYAHAMGNSGGALENYWKFFRENPYAQGGFIWDWKDQGLSRKLPPKLSLEDMANKKREIAIFSRASAKRALEDASYVLNPGILASSTRAFTVALELEPIGYNYSVQYDEGKAKIAELIRPEKFGVVESIAEQADLFSLKFLNNRKRLSFSVYDRNTELWNNLELSVEKPADATWRIAVSADSNGLKIFVDEKLLGEKKLKNAEFYGRAPLLLGALDKGDNSKLSGAMHRFVVWDEAISKDFFEPEILLGAISNIDFSKFTEQSRKGEYFVYGGDFNDFPNDGPFCINGLVQPDFKPSPQALNLAKLHQNIHAKNGRLSEKKYSFDVYNENFFKKLENVELKWYLTKNGKEVDSGSMDCPQVLPQKAIHVELELDELFEDKAAEYHLRVLFIDGSRAGMLSEIFGSSKNIVAWEQFDLGGKYLSSKIESELDDSTLRVENSADVCKISNSKFWINLDLKTGWISAYGANKTLMSDLRWDFWRPFTNNEIGAKKYAQSSIVWRDAAVRAKLSKYQISQKKDGATDIVVLETEHRYPISGTSTKTTYEIYPDSTVRVFAEFVSAEDLPAMPRLGMRFNLPKSLGVCEWYGKGPFENYPDRNAGAWMGVFKKNTDDMFYKYIYPQESSNLCSLRNALFKGDDEAIFVDSLNDSSFDMAVYPCLPEDIDQATHTPDIPNRQMSTVVLSAAQMGVGGVDSWGSMPAAQYMLKSGKTYKMSYLIKIKE